MAPPYTIGWVHNLDEAPATSDAANVIALAVIFSTTAFLFTILRFSVRWKAVGWFGLDDYAIAGSTLLGIGYSATAICMTKYGLGLDGTTFPLVNAVPFSMIQYAGGPIYCLAVLGFKVSLLGGYLRVAGFNRTYANILYFVLAMVTISQLIFTFLLSFACRPIAKQWDPSILGTCINTLPTYFALGGTSLAWDVLIIILPFPILRRLQLDKRNKAGVAILYGAGFFVTIVQALRIRTIAALTTYTQSKPIIEWSIVEINMGVIVACVPAFSPLLKSFGRKISSHSRSKSGGYGLRTGNNSRAAAQDLKSGTVRSRASLGILGSIHDDNNDEVELFEAKNGWGAEAQGRNTATRVHAVGVTSDGESDRGSGANSERNQHQQQQQITVVHEYTVQHGDAR